jgi:hypothetical protein
LIDRGADRDAIFEPLLLKQRDFIIRMVGTRDWIYQGETVRSLWLAYACRLPHKKSIVKIIHGKEAIFNLILSTMPLVTDCVIYSHRFPGRLQNQAEILQTQLSFGVG